MMKRARGSFEVKLTPHPAGEGDVIGRMSIDKQFRGDLEARSVGEMLAVGTQTKGSAGYVAIERVTGMLAGREGAFTLQHSAIMNRGVPQLSIVVVPDSGAGALAGIAGEMTIEIADGTHFYVLQYTLDGAGA